MRFCIYKFNKTFLIYAIISMIFSVRKRKTSILHFYRAEREEKQQATHFVFFSSAYKQTYDKVKKQKVPISRHLFALWTNRPIYEIF